MTSPGSSPISRLETQYRLGTTDTASATWTGNLRWGIAGVELAASGGAAAALDGAAVLALDATASFPSASAALDGSATLALDATATTVIQTAIALTGTATLAILTGADFPSAGLPIDARERAEAIEWYAEPRRLPRGDTRLRRAVLGRGRDRVDDGMGLPRNLPGGHPRQEPGH